MEKLLAIKRGIEEFSRQIGIEPATLNVLYTQKSLEEAKFWLGKELERRDKELIREE